MMKLGNGFILRSNHLVAGEIGSGTARVEISYSKSDNRVIESIKITVISPTGEHIDIVDNRDYIDVEVL